MDVEQREPSSARKNGRLSLAAVSGLGDLLVLAFALRAGAESAWRQASIGTRSRERLVRGVCAEKGKTGV